MLILRGAKELRHVLHEESDRIGFFECSEILPPKGSPLESHTPHMEGRKPLARRPPDDDVNRWERLDLLDWTAKDVVSEIGSIGRCGILINLDSKLSLELPAVEETPGKASTAGK
jgi:hypothetical protein